MFTLITMTQLIVIIGILLIAACIARKRRDYLIFWVCCLTILGIVVSAAYIIAVEYKKSAVGPSIESAIKTECPACPKNILLEDEGMDALPVGEIIKTESVAQVGEKFVAILRLPNGAVKAYELSQKPPRIFIKTDKNEYLKLPGL